MRVLMFGLVALVVGSVAHSACKVSDIQISSVRARFVDECSRSNCYTMKGVAVLRNRCSDAVGVQIQVVGRNKSGAPVAANELWPAGTRNISPGEYTFSMDHYLDYDSEVVRFEVKVISVRKW